MSEQLRRLMLLSEAYPPTMGGVATSAQRIARSVSSAGVEVHVATFDHSRPLESEDYVLHSEDHGVHLHRFGPFFLKHPDPAAAHLSEKHRAILRRRVFNQIVDCGRDTGVQAILSLYVLNAGFLSGLAANALNIPHYAGVRGNDVGRNIFDTSRFAAIAWTLQNARRIACVNQHLRDRLLIAFPQLAGITSTIPNGVSAATDIDVRAARERILLAAGWPEDVFIPVFIGTPREKKGVVQLIRAMVSLPVESSVRLLVVGPQLGGVERRIAGSAWDELIASGRAMVTGLVDRSEVARWAAGGDAAIMPSLDDGMANGLLEGMAMGLCPIASAIFSDVVHDGETGVLIDRIEPATIANALVKAAGERHRTQAMALRAKECVLQLHSPSAEAAAYIDLINSTRARER